MKKYKCKFIVHAISLCTIVICLCMAIRGALIKVRILEYMYIFCAIFAMYNLVNFLSSRHIINEHGITVKTLFKEVCINWDEIDRVIWENQGKLIKVSVSVYARSKGINISSWIENYAEIIQLVVNKCMENDRIYVESSVLEFVENTKPTI